MAFRKTAYITDKNDKQKEKPLYASYLHEVDLYAQQQYQESLIVLDTCLKMKPDGMRELVEQEQTITELQKQLTEQKKKLAGQQIQITEQEHKISEQKGHITEQNKKLANQQKQITYLNLESSEKTQQIKVLLRDLNELREKLTEQNLFAAALLNAAKEGNIKKIKAARRFVEIKSKNENGETALHLAVMNQHRVVAEYLIRKDASLFMATDNNGLTPIQHIAQAGKLEMLNWLGEKGKDIPEFNDHQEEFDKVFNVATPEARLSLANKRLWESAKHGKFEGVKDALHKGAEVNSKASDGDTALHKAIYFEYKEIAQLLIGHGADPTIRNNKQGEDINISHETVLDMAKTKNKKELILVVATPFLILAATHGSLDDIKLALDNDAHLNGADANGQTALHKAVLAGYGNVIKFLVRKYAEAGIDIHMTDKEGNSPYKLAAKSDVKIQKKSGEKDLAIYLLEKYGSCRKEVKLSNSRYAFVASLGQDKDTPSNTPDNSHQQETESGCVKKLG